jgi:tRNA(Arg) A34 adenosine deaminase TadA
MSGLTAAAYAVVVTSNVRRHERTAVPAIPASRRTALAAMLALAFNAVRANEASKLAHPDVRWFAEAEAMRILAVSWGDQSYGAVVVLAGQVVGFGPSRVVKDGNAEAHAERVAILDAQHKLGRHELTGAVLYSTSRPCFACERAAGRAKLKRMYFGSAVQDAGQPSER